jgi:tetratricopeptide (TPR) repeat protein
LKKALEYFQQAVERDPGYALAHAGLADGFAMIGLWSGTKRLDAYPIAKAAARRAIELDPGLAQPHAILGFIAMYHDWDWEATERELLRAIELNPRYVESYLFYAQYVGYIKLDREAAILCLRQAHELEPLLVMVMAHLGFQLIGAGRVEEGLAEAEKVLELEPTFSNAHWVKGVALRMMSRYDEAIGALRRGVDLTGGQLWIVGELAATYARTGRLEEAQTILDEGTLGDAWPSYAAIVYAAMGNTDAAFDWIEKAYERRDPLTPNIRFHPDVKFDQDDPRYREMVRKLALP